MNALKVSLLVIVVACLFIANSNAYALQERIGPYIQLLEVQRSYGSYINIFNICAGSKSLSQAVVLISSNISAVPLKINSIDADECRTYAVQIQANDPTTIKHIIIQNYEIQGVKNSLALTAKNLKDKIIKAESSMNSNFENDSKNKKVVGEEITKINALRSQLKTTQIKLNAMLSV